MAGLLSRNGHQAGTLVFADHENLDLVADRARFLFLNVAQRHRTEGLGPEVDQHVFAADVGDSPLDDRALGEVIPNVLIVGGCGKLRRAEILHGLVDGRVQILGFGGREGGSHFGIREFCAMPGRIDGLSGGRVRCWPGAAPRFHRGRFGRCGRILGRPIFGRLRELGLGTLLGYIRRRIHHVGFLRESAGFESHEAAKATNDPAARRIGEFELSRGALLEPLNECITVAHQGHFRVQTTRLNKKRPP